MLGIARQFCLPPACILLTKIRVDFLVPLLACQQFGVGIRLADRQIVFLTDDKFQIPVRKIQKLYNDPLDLIWLHAARKMGIRVERSAQVNASWNGDGVLTIGTPETLDPDDCLAQMILHEVCHALCEGPDSLRKLDWGLPNIGPTAKDHEYACLRLQATLADKHGMRKFFAATTTFRTYYDRILANPLADSDDPAERPAIVRATAGWERSQQFPWATALEEALSRTAQLARVIQPVTAEDSLWHGQGLSE